MNGRPPHSYDREGDLSHYRSVFEAIERRVIPEVVVTRITPYLLVLVSAAVLGVVLPHTGGAHGYDVLLRTAHADAESAGVLATLFTAFQRFDYDFVLTIVLSIIGIILVGEILSGWMRRLFQ